MPCPEGIITPKGGEGRVEGVGVGVGVGAGVGVGEDIRGTQGHPA
jgi:hypothetical protein